MIQARHLTLIFPGRRGHAESRLTAPFIPLGDDTYRLDEGFLCGPISFGDIVEAYPTDQEGVLIFRRRVKKAGMKRDGYVIRRDLVEKPGFTELTRKIEELGGFSAVDFGGLFLVFLPKEAQLNVLSELDRVAGISKFKRGYLDSKADLKIRWKKAKEQVLARASSWGTRK
jgi:hypothetical protein